MARRTLLVTYIATYLLAIASLIRYLVRFHHDGLWPIVLLGGGYLLLLLLEPIFVRRYRPLTYIYLLAQSGLVCAIAVTAPTVDYWAILFCPLVVQVMHSFPRRTGFLIAGLLTAITSAFLLWGLGLEVGLETVPVDDSKGSLTDEAVFFSESAGRLIVTVPKEKQADFEQKLSGMACSCVGTVTDGHDHLKISGLDKKPLVDLSIEQLDAAFNKAFGDMI